MRFTDLTGADGGFSVGQFRFILYLFVILVISVGIILLQRKFLPKIKTNVPLILICLMGLPLPLLSELLSIGGKSLAEYMYIFLVGYYVFSDDSAVAKAEKYLGICRRFHFIWVVLFHYILFNALGSNTLYLCFFHISQHFCAANCTDGQPCISKKK